MSEKATKVEVIKVLVDEPPENCDACPFAYGGSNQPGWQCSIMELTNDKGSWDIDKHKRPDWCPLVSVYSDLITSMRPILNWIDRGKSQ